MENPNASSRRRLFPAPARKAVATVVLTLVATVALPRYVQAQAPSPFSVEARTGVTFPMGDLSDGGAESGLLLAADVFWSAFPRVSIYGGWAWHRFSCDTCPDDPTASGPRGGVKVLFPLAGDATPWLRGGLSWSESDGLGGDPDREAGLEFGGGVDYALTQRFSLVPSLHYKVFSQEVGTPVLGTVDTDLSYVTLELGAHLHF